MLKKLSLVLVGAVGATTLILACSDDSPGDADAAVCDCDPAEPPLAGRITRVENRDTGSTPAIAAVASCPSGATLLGGGCDTEGPGMFSVILVRSGYLQPGPNTYGCSWNNPQTMQVTGIAWATCLNPAQ